MSFDSLLRHRLVRIRQVGSGTEDEMGHATRDPQDSNPFPGLVQPLTARESAQLQQAGAAVSDHRIFTRPRDLRTADSVRLDPDDGRRFEVTAVQDEAGHGHHLRVLAKLIQTGASEPAEGS